MPPRSGLPPSACVGHSVSADPGGALFYSKFHEHKCLYSSTYGHKLILKSDQSRSERKINGAYASEFYWVNLFRNVLYNIYYVKYRNLFFRIRNIIWILVAKIIGSKIVNSVKLLYNSKFRIGSQARLSLSFSPTINALC